MTADQYREHAHALAEAFGVLLIEDERLKPEAGAAGTVLDTGQPCICVAPIVDDCSYAVALHELGHCCAPWGRLCALDCPTAAVPITHRRRHVVLTVEEERAAWEWARHYALDWTNGMEAVYRFAFGSYLRHAARFGVAV